MKLEEAAGFLALCSAAFAIVAIFGVGYWDTFSSPLFGLLGAAAFMLRYPILLGVGIVAAVYLIQRGRRGR